MITWASQVAQWVENLPAIQETQKMRVKSLGWEDPLEEGVAAHSSILVCRIPWRDEHGGLQSLMGLKESDMTEVTEQIHS